MKIAVPNWLRSALARAVCAARAHVIVMAEAIGEYGPLAGKSYVLLPAGLALWCEEATDDRPRFRSSFCARCTLPKDVAAIESLWASAQFKVIADERTNPMAHGVVRSFVDVMIAMLILLLFATAGRGCSPRAAESNPIDAARWTAPIAGNHMPIDVRLEAPLDSIRYFSASWPALATWSKRLDGAIGSLVLSCYPRIGNDSLQGKCPNDSLPIAYPDTVDWLAKVAILGFMRDTITVNGNKLAKGEWNGYVFNDDIGYGRAVWAGYDSLVTVEAWGNEVQAYADTIGNSPGDTTRYRVDVGQPYVLRTIARPVINGKPCLQLELSRDLSIRNGFVP